MPNTCAADQEGSEAPLELLACESLVLGSVIVARYAPSAATVGPAVPDSEFISLFFPLERRPDRTCAAYVADSRAPPDVLASRDCITLLAPRRFLAGILPPGRTPERLPRSIGLRVLQRYLQGLLRLDGDRLCHRQADLAATAIRSLLAAALTPGGAEQGLGSRRRTSLLDRVTAHIDANLQTSLSADLLCESLGLSRSALYRATADAGGVTELILQRRMLAVRSHLDDARDRRPIVEIAQSYRFSDMAQFNRRFKALFAAPPGVIRRGAAGVRDVAQQGRKPWAADQKRRPTRRAPCK